MNALEHTSHFPKGTIKYIILYLSGEMQATAANFEQPKQRTLCGWFHLATASVNYCQPASLKDS